MNENVDGKNVYKLEPEEMGENVTAPFGNLNETKQKIMSNRKNKKESRTRFTRPN